MSLNKHNPEGRANLHQRDGNTVARALIERWQKLCTRFLPIAPTDSHWRFNRTLTPADPAQGWKLHLSATVLTACEVLQRVSPFLCARGVLFKAPVSLQELGRINSGLYYGYSQVGKFITVYPQINEEAVRLARQLHKLTCGLAAPAVPFDQEFRAGSCVYYRYGAFGAIRINNPDGTHTPAIRNPEGDLIPDLREAEEAKPAWVSDPFDRRRRPYPTALASPLKTTFRAFRALSQRGKGGVYQALDLSVTPPRLCLLKEGRKNGEVSWDGRDGHWMVRNEAEVLCSLQAASVNVPRVYASFEVEGHYYLVTEFIEGESLHAWLSRRQRRLTITQALRYGLQLARIIARIHAAGWVWQDCKPANLIVTRQRELRPVDFEGACPIDQLDASSWITPEFSSRKVNGVRLNQPSAPEDVYALGVTIYFLLTGRLLTTSGFTSIAKLRRNVPASIDDFVSALLASHAQQRPSAEVAAQGLSAILASLEPD